MPLRLNAIFKIAKSICMIFLKLKIPKTGLIIYLFMYGDLDV